jgi:hypothetical protein
MSFDPVSFNHANEAMNRKFTLADLNTVNSGTIGQVLSKDANGNLIFIDNGSGTDTKDLKVSSTDTTSDFLVNKITGENNKITITKTNSGANEKLNINIGTNVFDKTVDNANNVEYINTNSKLTSVTVNNAIDEVDTKANNNKSEIDTSKNNITTLQSSQGQIKLNSTDTLDYINNKLDSTTLILENNKIIAVNLKGLTSTIAELNYSKGLTGNIQAQINNLSSTIHLKDQVATKAALNVLTGMVNGDAYIVTADESQTDSPRDWYVYTANGWQLMGFTSVSLRNFTTNPINLQTEVTGALSSVNIDSTIARVNDVNSSINNVKGYANYTIARTYNEIGKVATETYSGDITRSVTYTYFDNTSEFYTLAKTIVVAEGNKTITQTYGYQTSTRYLMTITTTVATS